MATILVVDDTKLMRLSLGKLFKELGHGVVAEAASGPEAIEAYKMHHPDLVTLDINMLGMDGIQTLIELRKIDPQVKAIMVTADKEKDSVIAAHQAGARHYIIKPFNKQDVQWKLNEVLGLSHLPPSPAPPAESAPAATVVDKSSGH